MPKNRQLNYAHFVCEIHSQQTEKERTKLTVGGNLINYPNPVTTRTCDLVTIKMHINSTLLQPNCKYCSFDIKNFYLNTPMEHSEYMKIPIAQIPDEIIAEYNLQNKVHSDSAVYIKPMETVFSGMFLAEPNNLELWGSDAGHAYNLKALTREKLTTVGGPECWHDKFFEILHQMGFKPPRADPDTWMKYSKDGNHNEYIAVYIDDLAIYMEDPKSFCDKLGEVAPINYNLGCGYTRDEDNAINTLTKHWKYASIWPLLKPLIFWKGDTDELNAKTKGSDRIPTKNKPCLSPTLMDEGQARNHNKTYNGYKMEFWKFALTRKLICPVQHKITQKEQKETTKKGGISLTIMGQRQTYNSIHKLQRSPNETIGFNQDDHPYRMCNETGIPEFLELQIPEIPMVMMVTSCAHSLHDPTQQDCINARTLPIYKCHTHFKF